MLTLTLSRATSHVDATFLIVWENHQHNHIMDFTYDSSSSCRVTFEKKNHILPALRMLFLKEHFPC